MRLFRRWALLLFLYVTIDFMDPSIPGVVQLKSNPSGDLLAMEPTLRGGRADYRDEHVATNICASTRPSAPRSTCRKILKHDDSASLTPSSSSDSSPIPASS